MSALVTVSIASIIIVALVTFIVGMVIGVTLGRPTIGRP